MDILATTIVENQYPNLLGRFLDLKRYLTLIKLEHRNSARLHLRERLRAYRHGFLSQSFLVANNWSDGIENHVSDLMAIVKTARINGANRHFLNDKYLFHLLMTQFPSLTPKLYGLIDRGLYRAHGRSEITDQTKMLEFMRDGGRLILKPRDASKGYGISCLACAKGMFHWNLDPIEPDEIASRFSKMDRLMVTEYIQQGDYAMDILPDLTNTVRLHSLWDDETSSPFIIFPYHRFGTKHSFPVDNVAQGGMIAHIDKESGELGPLEVFQPNGARRIMDTHPDTGATVTGTTVTGWAEAVSSVENLCRGLPHLPYVGWDLVFTNNGFKIIEGNNAPDMYYLGPVLKDPRVRRFYKNHDCL